ncbi:hypothetical protein ACFV0T_02605 [Streptomyces sp. NPDC059582]|uniref:hypothetical protein n=1 Tax=Streptomyces sp. NPDC059582 TaxID=3346875 RepID=UPI0036A67790
MATDNGSEQTTAPSEPGPHPLGRVPSPGFVLRRVPQPIACALAVAAVPLVLHLPAPRPSSPLPGPGSPVAPASAPTTPTDTAPTPPGGTPVPTGTTSRPAVAPPTVVGPRAAPTHVTQASASAAPTAASAPPAPPPTRLASASWTLRADRLVLRALTFHGVVTVRTGAGATRVLKFTARSVEALDLDVTAGRGSAAARLRTRPATTSTLKGRGGDGVVTVYLHELSGEVTALDGAPLPPDRTVTITPDAVPPWLSDAAAPTRTVTFAGVTASQLTQFGGDLSLTGPLFRTGAG